MMQKPRYVYFAKPIGLDGPIKIGCSDAPAERLLTLAVWSPWPLEIVGYVPGDFSDENFLHRCFAGNHSHREWFHSTPNLREAITRILADGNLDWAEKNLCPSDDVKSPLSRKRTPEQKLRMSYSRRIEWATRRMRTAEGYFTAPDHVHRIMSKWRGQYRKNNAVKPSKAEIAVLEWYLADPKRLSVFVPFYKPKVVAPAREDERAA